MQSVFFLLFGGQRVGFWGKKDVARILFSEYLVLQIESDSKRTYAIRKRAERDRACHYLVGASIKSFSGRKR
jgi:hypothetical protein